MEPQSIILLHGALGSDGQFSQLKEVLVEKGCAVYTFNFSGHGLTPFNDKGFSIEVFAQELHQFILENKLTKPVVFGYSMGGYIALYLAFRFPDLLGPIATLATKFEWTKEIAQKEASMLNPHTLLEKVPKFAEALKQKHGTNWELLLEKTAAMMFALGDNTLLKESDYSSIQNKTLIGIGDKDAMVSLQETQAVYKHLPNAGMFMLPHTKHPFETVNTTLLSENLINFLERK